MLKDLFVISQDGFENYLASFVKIDKLYPIEGSDNLLRASVRGRDVVVSKDVIANNIYVYIPVETSLSHKYLSSNNLYRCTSDSYMLNSNCDQVNELLTSNHEMKLEDISQEYGGFFERSGRVKQIKIRGVYSQGYLTDIQSLRKAYPILNAYDQDEFDELEGVSFDAIGDEIFCEKYLVGGKKLIENKVDSQKHFNQRQKNLKKAKSSLVPGQFAYHYDTKQFGDYYKLFKPDDDISISVKVHGSSGIFANVKCYRRKEDCNFFEKLLYWIHRPIEYRLLYASRTKIRNEKVYDVPKKDQFYYGGDIWAPVRDLLEPFIQKNMIVYGEICGYVEGTTKMIQKGHDYGCKPGQWKFMPYRIVTIENNKKTEWNLWAVRNWTLTVINNLKENGLIIESEKLMPIEILYNGIFRYLYRDIPVDDDWNINILERMKNDKEFLKMEMQEPLCKMKAPREGVVIRINNDTTPRAWKLKSAAHYELERKSHDSEEVDIEENS